jgi:hypothetical protein
VRRAVNESDSRLMRVEIKVLPTLRILREERAAPCPAEIGLAAKASHSVFERVKNLVEASAVKNAMDGSRNAITCYFTGP